MDEDKPKGLSQTDQIVVSIVVALALLLIAIIAFMFNQYPDALPAQFRPNSKPFFENIEKVR